MTKFTSFIVLAEMRTGSNFLEANLNDLDGVHCFGELFNPAFIGYPKTQDILGISLQAREDDPLAMLDRIKAQDGLCGFRYFHDHDPRVLDRCLNDPHCAKIILTRNPLDSFVSWKLAQATGQWKLTNATHAKSTQIAFDTAAFEAHMRKLQDFQIKVLNTLQRAGQTAFYMGYDDLRDVEILNGLAAYLGVAARLSNLNRKLKKQNPEPLEARVANYDEMRVDLQALDRFDLDSTPHFEPRRGPAIPTYVAAAKSGLIHMPLRSGPEDAIAHWLAGIDGVALSELKTGFTQKTLRQWQQDHMPHRAFAVLRHPVARAHAAFCDRILLDGPGSFGQIRASLRKVHRLPIPAQAPDLTKTSNYDVATHRAAFLAFLQFLRNNLSAQTSIRVDPSWAGQFTLLQGFAQFMMPDAILREERLQDDLPALANQIGIAADEVLPDMAHPHEAWLTAIYDAHIEEAARAAYTRDYAVFGFENWG
ncbi:sulfotransferase family 2 domain-containing protein [Cognatiyoonia sp. IB215182]|uniref:sulfotransferase family 2 domain-containing protein n=1 Tax=Cognatiyoonia sp. IB215182 TaxID=3097353 RepID=UPI002A17F270|nr:sulfotransferase family 2 domain-containing protein [Cognatiyoonia sp. IB215182]MDX8353022.1 sulfotransferase family 2 domain-containing protein [Cognatiyoonia sp. IB215182]